MSTVVTHAPHRSREEDRAGRGLLAALVRTRQEHRLRRLAALGPLGLHLDGTARLR
jgi:hypothetical protein